MIEIGLNLLRSVSHTESLNGAFFNFRARYFGRYRKRILGIGGILVLYFRAYSIFEMNEIASNCPSHSRLTGINGLVGIGGITCFGNAFGLLGIGRIAFFGKAFGLLEKGRIAFFRKGFGLLGIGRIAFIG